MNRQKLLQSVEEKLRGRRVALRRAVGGGLNEIRHGTGFDRGDSADAALDAEHDEIHSHLAESETRELREIEDALQRIQAGTYGYCQACEAPIHSARLMALPFVTRCIECQRQVELSGADQAPAAKSIPLPNPGRIAVDHGDALAMP